MARTARARRHGLRVIPGAGVERTASAEADTPDPPAPSAELESAPVGGSKRARLLEQLSDEGLVALALQADAQACERLYRRHAAYCFNLGARIAGSTRDVEDVVHDAFISAFDRLGELRNPKAFRSWLGSIVVHGVRSRLRRARWVRFFGLGRATDPVDLESVASGTAPSHARAELAQIYALLQTLPADDRIAWTLRFVEGHDLASAAELAGCSLATIKRRIRRAQSFLEAHFVDSTQRESQP